MAVNKEFEAGYSMGWEWVTWEHGHPSYAAQEVRSRGVSTRTQWFMGFKKGAEDALNGIKKY